MSETILINYNPESLIHVPNMMKYAITAYKTGDFEYAQNLMDSMIGQSVTKEGQLAILQNLIPLTFDGYQVQFEILPAWFIQKE